MRSNQTIISGEHSAAGEIQSVLRNTYLLLSLTLLASAGASAFSVATNASFGASIIALIASFVLLFVTTGLRNSVWGLVSIFAFTSLMGYSMGPMLNSFIHQYRNGGQLIMTALGGTGITFMCTSIYIMMTKKDLSHLGKFIMIGLVIFLVASLANLFLHMPALQLSISAGLIFISVLLMMYDTSRIIHGGERNYILATIALYLDILMLFQNLLVLLGSFMGNRD